MVADIKRKGLYPINLSIQILSPFPFLIKLVLSGSNSQVLAAIILISMTDDYPMVWVNPQIDPVIPLNAAEAAWSALAEKNRPPFHWNDVITPEFQPTGCRIKAILPLESKDSANCLNG